MTADSDSVRILVTGANGQLGRDVCEVAASRGHILLGVDVDEMDIADAARVEHVVAEFAPDAIIHCAAWTAVDAAEDDRDGAMRANGLGTEHVAAAAKQLGAYLVTVSTDYVFKGDAVDGYTEDAPTDPINVYGESKLAAERATLAVPGAAVGRTAWLFGRGGSNFVKTIARLAAERDAIDVVTDQVGSPTYTGHLAAALVDCAEQRPAGVLHLAGHPTATWFDVARETVDALGVACEVRPTTSAEFVRPAARPACSILRVTRTDTPAMGDWREGVREVVASLKAAAV